MQEEKRKDEKWHRLLDNERELPCEDFRVWLLHKKSYPFHLSHVTVAVSVTHFLTYSLWHTPEALMFWKISIDVHMCIDTRLTRDILIFLSFLHIWFYLSAQERERREAIRSSTFCNLTYIQRCVCKQNYFNYLNDKTFFSSSSFFSPSIHASHKKKKKAVFFRLSIPFPVCLFNK